jgi:ketosteroid isomerase-like protein
MPTSNVDLVRGAYEAWNRRDFDAAFRFLDPDVEVSPPPDLPEAGTYRGRAQIRRLWEAFGEA